MTPTRLAIGAIITRDVKEHICRYCDCVIEDRMCSFKCVGDLRTLRERKGGYVIRTWRRVDTLVSEERPK